MDEHEAYKQGYQDAMAEVRRDLAATLRTHGISTGEDNEEVLSDNKVREVFAGVFGIKATDDEFGPEPTGKGVRKHLGLA